MDMLSMMMQRLPYFTPLMSSNTADSNATKRLLQLRQMGINTLADPLERRVRLNATEIYEETTEETLQISKMNMEAMDSVLALSPTEPTTRWRCVMRFWQVAEETEEYSNANLMFVDPTTLRFVVVEGAGRCCHYSAARAHELYCLLLYLGMQPKWVRSWAYLGRRPPKNLLKDDVSSVGGGAEHVDADSFRPALSAAMLRDVDAYIGSHPSIQEIVDKQRREAGVTKDGLRSRVLLASGSVVYDPCSATLPPGYSMTPEEAAAHGIFAGGSRGGGPARRAGRTGQSTSGSQRGGGRAGSAPSAGASTSSSTAEAPVVPATNACSACGKTQREGVRLRTCAGCKVARYCTVDCQTTDWPRHKVGCKAVQKAAKLASGGATTA